MDQEEVIPSKQPKLDLNLPAAVCNDQDSPPAQRSSKEQPSSHPSQLGAAAPRPGSPTQGLPSWPGTTVHGQQSLAEVFDDIEVLKQQLRVYAEDFAREREDRDKLSKGKSQPLEQQLLTTRCVQQIRGHCSNERYSSNRPLNVTVLAPRWWPWSGSDFSLLSRELAKQLARFSDVKVTYLVPENSCSEWEKRAAVRHGVTIVEAKEQPGFSDDPVEWLSFPPEGLSTDIVVGVGKKLSKMAQIFKKVHRRCQSIFIASDPYEELCLELTELSDRRDKKEKQKSQLRDKGNVVDIPVGDLSVPIGPKMYDEHCQSQKTRVFKLTPGILSDFADITHDTSERTKFKMLLMGGDDPEYFDCEGLDTVAKAVAELNDRSYELVYVGAAEYGDERFVKKFCQYGVNKNQLRIRSLQEDEEELKRWFREADLVIIPSSEQQFGMMGLAALSSGLPVLVHGDSGFGEALKAVKFGDTATVDSEDAAEWAKEIKKLQKIGRKLRLEQASLLRSFYDVKYSWEKQCGALIKEMFGMVFAQQGQG